MGVTNDNWTNYLAIRAAWLSFVGGKTQGEIATRLGVSPAKVHRLIAQAQRDGLVRFHVEGRPMECLQLEDQIENQFGLNSCIVAPDLGGDDENDAILAVGAAAGPMLASLLSSNTVAQVGVGMGRTLKAAFGAMPGFTRSDLSIIAITGSLTRKLSVNPYDVIPQLLERTGGEGYYLPVPYIAADSREKQVFLSQESISRLLDRAKRSDLFVVGIGSIIDEGHLVTNGMITSSEQETMQGQGVVADLMGRFLGADGKEINTELGHKSVGLTLEDVRDARVIALAGGSSKGEATLSALRSGVITDLVIDETLARDLSRRVGKTQSPKGNAA